MAAALVGTAVTGQDGASNTTVATAAKSTTTGNTLLVGFVAQEGEGVATISSCTDTAGNTYTALTQIGPGGGGAIARWFYSHNITGNASNVCTGTWSAATRYKHAIQIEISGLKNQAPVSSVGAVPTSSTTASVTIAMGSAVGVVFALATSTNDRTWTAGSGFTEIADWGTSAAAEYYTALNATGNVTTAITASGSSNLTFSATGFEEAASGASGTLARTNANDTLSASGTTTITGSLAKTNVNDTSSATGTTTVVGSLAVTNTNDTGAISGSVGEPVSGTLAVTNTNDTSAAQGTTTVVASLAKTNVNDTSAATGTTTVVGSLATTNINDTLSASGSVGNAVAGTVAVTNINDTSSATGTTTVLAILSFTNTNDSLSASGSPLVIGTLAKTNVNDTLSASGTVGNPVLGQGTRLPLTGVGA